MKRNQTTERGQALVIIAFALIGLIGLTGLAIDGGNMYSERRNAQNAADTAVLATALRMANDPDNWGDAESTGLTRAESNGYDNNGTQNTVEIHNPPTTGTYAGDEEYVQVIITSKIETYFAPIVGITQLTNQVDAVARVQPAIPKPFVPGTALFVTEKDECPAAVITGTGDVSLINGGLYVNSDCSDDPGQMSIEVGGDSTITSPSLCTVGANDLDNGDEGVNIDSIQAGCDQYNMDDYIVMPNPPCPSGSTAYVDPVDESIMHPGNWSDDFPPDASVTQLLPGAYCINGVGNNFEVHNGTLHGTGVVIYVEQGYVNLNGGSVQLSAPTYGDYENLLLILPESNDSTVNINGNASFSFIGTILAPSSDATLNGEGETDGMFKSQIIVKTADIAGTGDGFITYDGEYAWKPTSPPKIEFTE